MRDSDLTDTLKAAQEASIIDPLVKIVLTHGETTYTYLKDRILARNHPEGPWSQTAEVLLDNGDNALTDLALQGYQAVISYGAVTPAGEEYSDCAPLWVLAPRFNSSLAGEFQLTCELSLMGIPNFLALDEASRNYIPDEDDTKTIETLLIEILGASLGCFSHCKAYEVVVDSRDSLINTYKPKDSLRIYKGNSRLAIAKKLLGCTKCVMLAKADSKLHIFVPTISGEVYASQYSLESGHTFFSKAYRETLVLPNFILASSPPPTVPNWVTVLSDPYTGEAKDQTDIDKFGERKHTADYGAGTFESNEECATQAQLDLDGYIALHDPYYEGVATDPVSIAALATDGYNGEIREYWQASFESDAQAKLVAEAKLAKYKLNAEMGAADVPLNVGAEVYDYIKVTDSREGGSERTGTMGSLIRHYDAWEAEWRMAFSLGQRPEAVDVMAAIEEDAPYFGRLIVDNLYAKKILADSLDMYWIDPAGNIDLSKIGDTLDSLPDGAIYARVKTLHLDAEGGIKMDEHIIFDEGFDPRGKETAIHRGTTPPEDLTKLWIDTSTELNVVYRYNGVTAQWERASPANLDQLENGVDYARVKKMALNTDGLVLIDQIYTVGGDFGLTKSAALTADGLILMDELVDGDYARVASAGLSAQGLVLLDQVVEGTYGLVNATYISAGRIILASVEQSSGYRTVSDTEKDAWAAGIQEAIAAAAGAQETADGKILSFYQDNAPTSGMSLGDFWIDTNDKNKIYRYNGTSWVLARDTDIPQAITDAAGAQATADGKVVTFYQDEPPTAEGIGDLWVDTDDKNKLYRWNGSQWVTIRDTDIAQALADAAAAQSDASQAITDAATAQGTADGKVTTFYQSTAPTAEGVGDLWLDTDDDRLYRWSGASWVEIQDADIATAIANAATAQTTADGKIVSFYADEPPEAGEVGDFWIDTNDKNKLYRWNGTTWVLVRDTDIAQALADAATAQETADGKILSFYQTTAPTSGMSLGDLWFDTDDGYKVYRYNGTSWVLARDTGIAQAIDAAAGAQATADGKVVTFYQTSVPTAEGIGDLWVDTDDKNKLYRWNGSTWVQFSFVGEWYSEAGVHISATTGIDIYGAASALTTRAYAGGPVQCYVGADGKLYAGGGAVVLDATYGITIKGQSFRFLDSGGVLRGIIYATADGMYIAPWSPGGLIFGAVLHDVLPKLPNTYDLGSLYYTWHNIYFNWECYGSYYYPKQAGGFGTVGAAAWYFLAMHAATGGFVEHSPTYNENALAKIRGIKLKPDKTYDLATFPDELLGPELDQDGKKLSRNKRGFRIGTASAFHLEAIKELADRIEALEAKGG